MEEVKAAIDEIYHHITLIRQQIARKLVGQEKLVDAMLTGLLTGGHILIEGVPGLAKTSAVKALASVIQADFKRIQFTPDLLPADLTGTEIYRPKTVDFVTRKGPIFNHIILADEINRAPSKVQSALLEAMEEKQVTIGDNTFELPRPFLVLATQNPIEQEGTYALPEAQVDRFMLKVLIDYPDRDQELEILKKTSFEPPEDLTPVVELSTIEEMAKVAEKVYVDAKLKSYIVDLVTASRHPDRYGMNMAQYIEFGASPRATIFLARAARVRAFLSGRAYVTPEDIKRIGPDVLRHRIILSFEAQAEDIDSQTIIQNLFDSVEVP